MAIPIFESAREELGDAADYALPRFDPYADYPKKVGQVFVERTLETLAVRRENAGGLGIEAYLLFALAMLAITLIGFMGMMQGAQSAQATGSLDVARAVAPTNNHFALLWLVGIGLLAVGIPIYIKKAYGASLTFVFDKESGFLTENAKNIVPLRRIEGMAIRETKDPDDRYLYLLEVLHTDGYELLIYNGYEERDVMTLASEIASFLDCRTKFTGIKA